ncbi:MAG: hypothetical protein LBM66_02890, partial [Bifidobacteriaceae bacterium]|nr:hypothetical protein [Bifidobacteriaceae bacterium]
MHRRIRLATIVSVLVAVVLLGVPLVIFAIQVTQRATLSELQGRISTLARVVDSSSDIGFDVNKDMIDDYADGSVGRLSAHVTITLPDGATVQGGPTVGKPSITKFTHTAGGADIDYSYSWWRLQRLSAWGPGLVLVAAAVAIAAGVAMAQFQAKRLTQPLVYLAASAEQAGSGQVRPRLKASGIEEIDLVAEELSRSAERMARRLAAEREFAADAYHQLRTPLTALSMRLEEIEGVTDQPEVAEEARVSLEQIERLTQTINELLGRSSRESRSDSI